IVAGEAQLDADVHGLEELRAAVQRADETVDELRTAARGHEAAIKEARGVLEATRATVAELDVARATRGAGLSQPASACVAEVEQLEREGSATPDARVIEAEEPDDESTLESRESKVAASEAASTVDYAQRTLTAEEAIAALKGKIDRLGPVNMMAIDQFD